jgi:hypothetical protein
MPVKIVHPNHVEIVGLGRVLITAPHASTANSDLHTGSIVEEAALTSRSFAAIGKVNRDFMDPDRLQSAESELRKGIENFKAEDGIRYHLDIHGKMEPGVTIRTPLGSVCSDSTMELVKLRLAKDFSLTVSSDTTTQRSTSPLSSPNPEGAKDDSTVETVKIEFGPEERQFQREKVISDISEIADILNAKLGALRTD